MLQAYALSKVMEQKGHQVSIIDYQLPDLRLRDWLHIMHLSYAPHAPVTVTSAALGLPKRFDRIEQFRKKYLHRTEPAWNDEDLQKISRQFDTLVTGSDEIFRTDLRGNLYSPLFLNFADAQRQNLHAYAACSGSVTDYRDKNEVVAKLLNRFDSISVRDGETQTLVKKLTGTNPPVVLDPTLLWKFDELPLPEPPAKNFVLVYGFFRSLETDRMVREVADKLGAEVVSVGWASKYAHHNLMEADTLQWLSCFKHARLVFTNCYHGLMFATHYQRDFLVFESDKARPKLNDFIHRFSLAERFLPSGEQPSARQLDGMDHALLQNSLKPYAGDSIKFIETIGQRRENKNISAATEEKLESWAINGTQPPDHPANTKQQLKTDGIRLGHLLWEAFCAPLTCPPMLAQMKRLWYNVAAGGLMFAGVLWLHIYANAHLLFLPLYLLPCAWFATKINPRLGVVASLVAAVSGALVQHHADPDFQSWLVVGWNIVMRFVTMYFLVSLMGRLYRPNHHLSQQRTGLIDGLVYHWAVVLSGAILFAGIVFLQMHVSPHLLFMPLYLIPCLMIALVAGWGWGSIMAILCSVAGPLVQSLNDLDYQPQSVMTWNIIMRFIVFQTIVLLLNFNTLKANIASARSSRAP